MKTIRKVQNIELTYEECGGLYQLRDGENKSKKFGSYGGSYFKQVNEASFLEEAKQEIEYTNININI